MKFLDYVNDAQVNLRRAKLRTTLTISALIIGTLTLSLTTAFTQGISAYINTQLHAYGQSNIVNVRVGSTKTQTSSSGVPIYQDGRQAATSGGGEGKQAIYTLNQSDLDAVKAIAGVQNAYPDYTNLNINYIQLGSGQKFVFSTQASVPGESTPLAAGSFPSDGQAGLVLPYPYVQALGGSIPQDVIGKTVTLHILSPKGVGKDYLVTVTGVLPDTAHQPSAYLDNKTMGDMIDYQTGNPGQYTDIVAVAATDVTPSQLDTIKAALDAKGYNAMTFNDVLKQFSKQLSIVTFGLSAFAGIALLAAMIGIVNTLLMAVFERVQEIGLLKAMGMRRRGIFFQFLIEAGSIGFWGGVIGVLLGELIGRVANPLLIKTIFTGFPGKQILSFPPLFMLGIIALGTLIGLLAGAFPAWRASRLDPIEALRRE
ncbi:MAG TPA: ABC transporter permease [Candidatus Saccharimonadia bacterium]|jgi:putative ABC transport system permease protein